MITFLKQLQPPQNYFSAVLLIVIISLLAPGSFFVATKSEAGFVNQNLNLDVGSLTDLSIRLQRHIVQASSLTEQTLPMLVSLRVKDLMLSYRAPLDLVCVLDHSGSMSGEKIELLKNTFKYLLHFLNEKDRLAIVLFDDRSSTLVPLVNTSEANKKRILAAVKTIHAGGGTDINLGVQEAIGILKQRNNVNQVTGIFLLSDGLDGQAGTLQRVKETLFHSELQKEVILHTFGFGGDHDPQLMADLADITDGSFYFIRQLDDIDEAFVECLGGMQSSIADRVEIFVRPVQSQVLAGVEIVKGYGGSALWSQYQGSYITSMSNLMTGGQKDYVLELKLPKMSTEPRSDSMEVKVATVEAVITVQGKKQITKQADLHIILVNEENEKIKISEEDNKEVMKHYYRVKGASLMEDARKLADERRYEEGTRALQNFREEIGNSVLKEEAFVKDMIRDLNKAINYVDPDAYYSHGRHSLIGNHRAQMRQHSSLDLSYNTEKNAYVSHVMKELEEL